MASPGWAWARAAVQALGAAGARELPSGCPAPRICVQLGARGHDAALGVGGVAGGEGTRARGGAAWNAAARGGEGRARQPVSRWNPL